MDYRIELRDKSFNLLEVLEKEAKDISFEFKRIGGCGAFSFEVPRKYGEEGLLGGDFDIRIFRYNPSTRVFDRRYSGFIEEKTPGFDEDSESIRVDGYGYSAQLDRILVDETYTSMEISAIIKDLLDTYVTPNTDIAYTAGDIEDTGFTAAELTFSGTVKDAIETCAEIVGSREWGVDMNRNFYFKARSEVVTKIYPVGGVVKSFSVVESFKDIVNKVKIIGGKLVDESTYTYTKSDAASILKYGLREYKKSVSAITTADVAEQMADAILAEKTDLPRKASMIIVGDETQHEASLPLGLLRLEVPGTRYGEKEYFTFLYSGHIDYQIDTIKYSIDDNGTLTKSITLGQKKPGIAESISQLEYELEQLQDA
ncbi:MAG: hypothetical protein WC369_02135 [Dehalococcoidales bacterium]|jgi:hypothetical protein